MTHRVRYFPLPRIVASAAALIEAAVRQPPAAAAAAATAPSRTPKKRSQNREEDPEDPSDWVARVTVLAEVMHISKEHATVGENAEAAATMEKLLAPLLGAMEILMGGEGGGRGELAGEKDEDAGSTGTGVMAGVTDLEFAKQLVLDALLTSVIATKREEGAAAAAAAAAAASAVKQTPGKRARKRTMSDLGDGGSGGVRNIASVKVVVECIRQTDNPQTRTSGEQK